MPTRTTTSSPTRDSERVGRKRLDASGRHPARNWDGSRWTETLCTPPRLLSGTPAISHPHRHVPEVSARRLRTSRKEHRVTVAEESVPGRHRRTIGLED